MSKPSIILIGAGGHAHSCIDVIEEQGHYQVAGLIDVPGQKNTQHLGYRVIGADSDLPELSQIYQYALITLGQIKTAEHRARLYHQVLDLGFQLPTIISPSAYVSRHAKLGAGTIVMHGAIVNARAFVGNNSIINSCSLIEHDACVGDHCHISTGAILNGDVVVGSRCFVGSGSIIKQGVHVADNSLIGMGLVVRHNLAGNRVFKGNLNNV